jgi:hypothetical protein
MALVNDLEFHRDRHLDSLKTLSGGIPAGLSDQLSELAPPLAEYETAAALIANDANLTELGRQNARADARAKATAAIEAWTTGKTAGVDAQAAALDATRRTQAEKGATPPTALAVTFMAERLGTLDPLEVDVLYSDATDQERLLIEVATESVGRVPRRRPDGTVVWEHILSPERIAQGRAARLERVDPAASASLRDLARIRRTYEAMAGAAVGLVKG